uniref:Replication factor A C-terminal domain-containing protein n=1 Tax=Nicotiana tabacum TaxID=4097 RepID=A0A1S4B7T1_TOBAC|nr:PREDICTED: uncharacterized protein LOC107805454 [Nicotiana tabacum]
MAPNYNYISEIAMSKMSWNLKVRVVRLWHIPDREKPKNSNSIVLIIQDEKGDRIHATIGRAVMRSGREVNLERFSQTTSQRSYSVSEELAAGKVEEGKIWIVATVVNLELERRWSYVVCKKCLKKVDKIGNKFYCKKCERVDHFALKRYRLQVRVIDVTGSISLLLWDREATKLTGKSADTLKEGVVETSSAAYECSHPLEIDAILDRKFMFKLTVKPSNIEENDEVYIVVKVSDDEDLIQKYSPSSEAEAYAFTDSVADNEMISPALTPSKRTRDNAGPTTVEVDDDAGQLSSNRVKRVIKKEKNP